MNQPPNSLTAQAAETAELFFGLSLTAPPQPLAGGRVNDSFRLWAREGDFVLQRLNDSFQGSEALALNWLQVEQRAASSGLKGAIPPLVKSLSGRPLADFAGGFWRLTGYLPGRPPQKSPAETRQAAALLGRFHRLLNQPAPLELAPLPEGELTNQHLSRPEEFEAIELSYDRHPHLEQIKPLIRQAAEAAWLLPSRPAFLAVFSHHELVIHADPKADNFLFSSSGKALALLDWDSVSLGHILVDLAELIRSWTVFSPPGGLPDIDEAKFALVASGYGESGLELSAQDLELIPAVLRAIALNLCRRYLIDSLAELYFRWDSRRYGSLFEQNCRRAETMLQLAESILSQEIKLIEIFARHYRAEGA